MMAYKPLLFDAARRFVLLRCVADATERIQRPYYTYIVVRLQQDIGRGRDMVDSLFTGYHGGGSSAGGTHNAILSSSEYLSQARRDFNNIEDGFYISPAFLDKMTIHVAKNFMDLPVSDSLVECSASASYREQQRR